MPGASQRPCQIRPRAIDFRIVKDVTPREIAASLGVDAKTFRAWLRSEKAAGHPILDYHEHQGRWRFTQAESNQLLAEYRATGGRGRALGQSYQPADGQAASSTTPVAAKRGSRARAGRGKRPAVAPGPAGRTPRPAGLPPLPPAFTRAGLIAAGFEGWRTWPQLRTTGYQDIPSLPGVYVVVRTAASAPRWTHPGTGGYFKGRNPSVSPARLDAEWVPGARSIYIGKAAARKAGGANDGLRKRLGEYGRFGAGEPIAHWGGRFVWQLADADRLLVAWHAITWNETAREYEKRLLARFAKLHDGRRPFANLTG